MQVVEIVFSPTGGTQKVADILADALARELSGADASPEQIDLTDPFIDETDLAVPADAFAVIAMPCFAGRVPAVAMERLAKIKGSDAKCAVVNVYGNRAFDDALLEMEDGAAAAGFEVIAAVAAIAEHSIMHQFATGRPDATDREQLGDFARRIAKQVKGGENTAAPRVPGNSPYKKEGGPAMVPKITGTCVSCGQCAKSCPVTAINSVDYASDKGVCFGCMRCIEICPQKARSISKAMVKVASLAIKKAASERKECELFL